MSFEQFKKKYHLFNSHDNLGSALQGIKPSGGTGLRDSIAIGIKLIMGMNADLIDNYGIKDRHFLHIVITDGQDTSSKIKLEDLGALMYILGQCIPNQMITTHFIGIDFSQNSKDAQELFALSVLGGDTSDIHVAQSANIGDILSRIQAKCGVITQTKVRGVVGENASLFQVQQEQQKFIELSIKKYIVVFNLDISGSMSGQRWRQVCECVQRFSQALTPHDFVSVILFNDKPTILQPIQVQICYTVSEKRENYYSQNTFRDVDSDNQQLIRASNKKQLVQEEKCCCSIF